MSSPFLPFPLSSRPLRRPAVPVPASLLGAVAVGALLLLPGQARADGYGHAEITLGFPHGEVTVGRTWEEHPRQVVVEEVTHKYPEADDESDEGYVEDDEAYGEASADPDVVIEKRIVAPRPKRVTIIERYEEAPVHVVRHVYVERPACERPEVVVYSRPRVCAPSPVVIVAPSRPAYRGGGWRGGNRVDWHGGGSWHSERGGHEGPRDLFPEDRGRPVRMRGIGHGLVQVGAHR